MTTQSLKLDQVMDKSVRFVYECQNQYGFSPQPGHPSDVEATRFALDVLKLSGHQIPNLQQHLKWVESCQKKDGGFAPSPSVTTSQLDTTYYASRIFNTNHYSMPYPDRCEAWLLGHQTNNGGFHYPSESQDPENIDNTYYAVQALSYLDQQVFNKQGCLAFLKSCQTPQGGIGNFPGCPPDTDRTYCGIHAMMLLSDSGISNRSAHCDWLFSCRKESGGFGNTPQVEESVPATYWSVHALSLLKEHIPHINVCVDWLLSCQSKSGGFGKSPELLLDPEIWWTYCAVHAILLLTAS